MTDRKRFAYFPLWTADFLGGVRFMSPQATGVYIVLLCIEWENGPLPCDVDALDRVAPGARSVWPEIKSKFVCDEFGRLVNVRLERERAFVTKQSENGSKGGRPKNPNRKPDESQSESQMKAKPKASDSDSDSYSDSEPNSQPELLSAAAPPPAPTRTPKPVRSKPKDTIAWSPESGWQGITEPDRKAWEIAYPACSIDRQLAAAEQWLRSNPAQAKKSRWRKFITGWLSRSQDRGGDIQANRPAVSRTEERRARNRLAWDQDEPRRESA